MYMLNTDKSYWLYIRMVAGMAEMKPKSLPDFSARTPQCQSWYQPGGFKALQIQFYIDEVVYTRQIKCKPTIRENQPNNQTETYCRHLLRNFR